MRRCLMRLRKGVLFWLLFLFFAGVVLGNEPIPNWPAPATWTPTRGQGIHTLADATPPRPFTALSPCRIVDTRGTAGVPINTGGGFAANEFRTWVITGLCGIPVGARSVSLNITVTSTGGETAFGFVKVWPGGGVEPNVSTLNWSTAGVTESNAAIVPLGSSPAGSISLRSGNNSSQVIVDTNGYFLDSSSAVPVGEFFGLVGSVSGTPVTYGVNAAAGTPFGVGGAVTAPGNSGA